jgi:hypothetical protein
MKSAKTLPTLSLVLAVISVQPLRASDDTASPYPKSRAIGGIKWHWETRTTAALGSDLWATTWGPDGHLYAGWGDGGGFGGSDSEGRVALGFARIEGGPEHYRGINVNGGKTPEHSASFPKKGKTLGVAFVDGVLYATVNLQDGKWPDINHALEWSADRGATWQRAEWLFSKKPGNFQPARFLNFGPDYTGIPKPLAGYVYLYGGKRNDQSLYLARAPRADLRRQSAYEYYRATDDGGQPAWTGDFSRAKPVFSDPHDADAGGAVFCPALKRYLLTAFHGGAGSLGVFESTAPWGPWATIAYKNSWGGMGPGGEGLTCDFPQKWMSADGHTLWCVFSVYGDGAKRGINAHDRFNLVKATLVP